ncbi:unnamed protein product [Clavelina lepadiformis]|uniref:Uncharacterized protein n=1 Tax=Clavelina lepadiformis TaxID=159417 RepID=A0ABP0GTM8_CLALP
MQTPKAEKMCSTWFKMMIVLDNTNLPYPTYTNGTLTYCLFGILCNEPLQVLFMVFTTSLRYVTISSECVEASN